MSQPLSNLVEGSMVAILETINGTTYTVPMVIIANNINNTNPYGSDVTLCLRNYLTGQAGTSTSQEKTCKYSTSSTGVNYEGSNMDSFISGEWLNRLDSNTKACISMSTIICYSIAESADYTLARKAFALSCNEVNMSAAATDHSAKITYFTTAASRKAGLPSGATNKYWFTRTPWEVNSVVQVEDGKNWKRTPTGNNYARPACNIYSSTLVSDEPDETTGAYTLITDSTSHLRKLDFECKLGETTTMPIKVCPVFASVCSDGLMSVYVCNNYNDDNPVWETAEEGVAHDFTNSTKTSDSWCVGLKVTAQSENTIYVYEPAALVITTE